MDVSNRYVIIKSHIDGAPEESDFELKTSLLALSLDPGSNDVIVKNLYVSIDPYQINRMKSYCSSQKSSDYAVAIIPGEVNTQHFPHQLRNLYSHYSKNFRLALSRPFRC